jgi:hypothetical protein
VAICPPLALFWISHFFSHSLTLAVYRNYYALRSTCYSDLYIRHAAVNQKSYRRYYTVIPSHIIKLYLIYYRMPQIPKQYSRNDTTAENKYVATAFPRFYGASCHPFIHFVKHAAMRQSQSRLPAVGYDLPNQRMQYLCIDRKTGRRTEKPLCP